MPGWRAVKIGVRIEGGHTGPPMRIKLRKSDKGKLLWQNVIA